MPSNSRIRQRQEQHVTNIPSVVKPTESQRSTLAPMSLGMALLSPRPSKTTIGGGSSNNKLRPYPRRICHTIDDNDSFSSTASPTCLEDIVTAALDECISYQHLDKQQKPQQPQQEQVSQKRSVHFDLTSNQTIPSTLTNGLTNEDIANMWWAEEEANASMLEARTTIHAFVQENKQAIKEFHNLVTICNGISRDDALDSNNEQKQNYAQCTFSSSSSNNTSSSITIRGYEMDVIPILKVIRKKHVQSVVQHSKKVPKRLSLEMKERMISQRSVQLSRPLRLLSQIIGTADEKEALFHSFY